MNQRRQSGSVIIIALILGAVSLTGITFLVKSLLQTHEATIRYGLGQSAFHLAEGGIELAMAALTNDQIGGSEWPQDGDATWQHSIGVNKLGQYNADGKVKVVNLGDDRYLITSMASVDFGGSSISRALEVTVEQARTPVQIEESTGSGLFDYGMISRDSIKLEFSNSQGIRVSSYDSNADFGIPEFGVNTGYEVTIATLSEYNSKIKINNSTVNGSIRTAGGTVSYTNNSSNPTLNATVVGPDSTNTYGVDANRISTDFDVELTDPEMPDSSGYSMQYINKDTGYWKQAEINIGSSNIPTWIETQSIDTNDSTVINITGDVVFDVERNLNLKGEINIKNNSSLTITASETISITAEYIDQQYPEQFQIITNSGRDVVLNNFRVFSGVINAPKSKVQVYGDGKTPYPQFRGAIIANSIDSTNSVEFYYDINLGNGGSDDSSSYNSEVSVGSLKVISWSEVTPSLVAVNWAQVAP